MKILLEEVMITRDITYQELENRSGMACGRNYTPIEYLEKIAQALNMRISDLYDSDWK